MASKDPRKYINVDESVDDWEKHVDFGKLGVNKKGFKKFDIRGKNPDMVGVWQPLLCVGENATCPFGVQLSNKFGPWRGGITLSLPPGSMFEQNVFAVQEFIKMAMFNNQEAHFPGKEKMPLAVFNMLWKDFASRGKEVKDKPGEFYDATIRVGVPCLEDGSDINPGIVFNNGKGVCCKNFEQRMVAKRYMFKFTTYWFGTGSFGCKPSLQLLDVNPASHQEPPSFPGGTPIEYATPVVSSSETPPLSSTYDATNEATAPPATNNEAMAPPCTSSQSMSAPTFDRIDEVSGQNKRPRDTGEDEQGPSAKRTDN
jgi:hypothetical protein